VDDVITTGATAWLAPERSSGRGRRGLMSLALARAVEPTAFVL